MRVQVYVERQDAGTGEIKMQKVRCEKVGIRLAPLCISCGSGHMQVLKYLSDVMVIKQRYCQLP